MNDPALAQRGNRGHSATRLSFGLLVPLCVLACTPATTRDPSTGAPPAGAVATGQAARATATPSSPTPSASAELASYRRAVAQRIERASKMDARRVAATPQVTALTVLGIKVDRKGQPVEVWVVRSSRQTALDQRARRSVYDAAPLPAPPASVLAGSDWVAFSETWMFLADGRFEVLSASAGR